MIDTKPPAATTDSGIRAPSDEFSLTVGPTGPTMLHDRYLVEARTLYSDVTTDPDREHLAANIVGLVHDSVSAYGHRASIEASDLVAARANRALWRDD